MFLEWIPYIYYPLLFRKHIVGVRVLINSDSEFNAMTPVYVSKLGFKIYFIDVKAQKIDGSTLKIFGLVLASFQMDDKLERVRFFQETFLVIDIRTEIVLDMLFLTFSNADVQFVGKELTWKSYTIVKALPITKWIELVNKKKFAKAVLDEDS